MSQVDLEALEREMGAAKAGRADVFILPMADALALLKEVRAGREALNVIASWGDDAEPGSAAAVARAALASPSVPQEKVQEAQEAGETPAPPPCWCGRATEPVPDGLRNEARLFGHRWWCPACGQAVCVWRPTPDEPAAGPPPAPPVLGAAQVEPFACRSCGFDAERCACPTPVFVAKASMSVEAADHAETAEEMRQRGIFTFAPAAPEKAALKEGGEALEPCEVCRRLRVSQLNPGATIDALENACGRGERGDGFYFNGERDCYRRGYERLSADAPAPGHLAEGPPGSAAAPAPLTEQRPRIGVAVIVRDDAGKLLLGKRAKEPNRGKWVIPGGGIRWDEPWRDAGRREILEETGLHVEITDTVSVGEIIGDGEHRVILFAAGRVVGGTLRGGDDLLEPGFFSPAEIAGMDLSWITQRMMQVAAPILPGEQPSNGAAPAPGDALGECDLWSLSLHPRTAACINWHPVLWNSNDRRASDTTSAGGRMNPSPEKPEADHG